MKNKRWFRLTGWLLTLALILTVFPIAVYAEEGNTGVEETVSETYKPVIEMVTRPAEVDITGSVKITFTDKDGNDIQLSAMDPNKENRMNLTVSGLMEDNAIGDETQLAVTVPENIRITRKGLQNFSNDDVSVSLSDNKLLLSWKNGKQDSVNISIEIIPHLPTDDPLSGSYALITKSGVMVGATAYRKDNRDRISSIKISEKNGLFFPQSDERSVWTLKHVSGNYYTLYSENSQKYLEIVLPNHATLKDNNEEDAQKLLVQKTSDGYYTFQYDGKNLNNSGNNAANGFASYNAGTAENEKFRLCNPSDIAYTDVLVFDVNGGTGESAPKAMALEAGTQVTLPDLNATKSGQNFIGWAEVKNILSKVSEANHTYHEVYLPGTSYTIKSGTNTLYAVYNSTDRNVTFGIRKDGIIVDEPNDNSVNDYIGHFTVNGILKEGHWVIDLNPAKPVNDYYIENNVTAALNWMPSAEEIAAALMKEGKVEFNPETQYIHYYVLKYAGKWKIDGVIRNKDSVEITYEANAPAGMDKTKVKNMPGGYQVAPGTDVLIGADKDSTQIKRPTLNGYFFMGWNTEKDGSGEYFDESSTVHLKNNLQLYAQWKSEAENPLEIRISSNWPKGKAGYVGAKITLSASLTGFEGRLYTLQWQYSTDLENWVDVPGAHDITYTYTLDETTTHYTWRVVAQDIH